MAHNAANSQRPSRADFPRKMTAGDSDRRTLSPAGPALPSDMAGQHPTRNLASPPPGQYANFTPGYHTVPPAMSSHSQQHHHHHQQHHRPPGPQAGAHYPSYSAPAPTDSYGYTSSPYPQGRHNVDPHHYARPPSRTASQSSSSAGASPHDTVAGSRFTPHYSPSYHSVNPNPSGPHSARTRWAWVPVEVPQTHLPDDAHLHYPPYPGAYYATPAAASAPTASPSHQTYQPPYSEGSIPASPAYGVQASPNYTPSYPYHLQPSHYGPPPSHSSHTHAVAPSRGPWSASGQSNVQHMGAARDNIGGGGASRRQSNQSSRTGSFARKNSSYSSAQLSSPQRGPALLPSRPPVAVHEAQDTTVETGVLPAPAESLSSVGEPPLPDAVSGLPELAYEADADLEGDAPSDLTKAERVPGSGLRPHYHPQQGPRSDFVLWCGNVPQDATVEELWEVFSRLTPEEYRNWIASPEGQEHAGDADEPELDGHGVLSIFIISRSNCAFINYSSPVHLDRAVKYYHGKQVRPSDPRCPKLVCRVRKKDDEAQAGVAGQRGRGIHVAWLKQQRELERAQMTANDGSSSAKTPSAPPSSADPLSPQSRDSPVVAAGLTSAASYSSGGSASYTSTNSSLFRHPSFRHRFFILKSLRSDDLDRSIETGYWATQPHNENVLDQAYRNSETVYLIFGVNQTGQFYGYAKMAGPIHTHTADTKGKDEQRRRASLSSVVSTSSSSVPPATIPESADESARESGPVASGAASSPDSTKGRSHPTLTEGEIQAANGFLATLGVDASDERFHTLPMMSPLPLSPTLEKDGRENVVSPQRNDTITPRMAGSIAASSTWPYTSTKASTSETDWDDRPKLNSTLSKEAAAPRLTAEPGEYGVRRIDMETDTPQIVSSQSDREQLSLGPSDSASWSSADPRVAEQITLRAVIHNLRLDEMESRGKAEMLESQLRSVSNDTDTTVTAKGSDQGANEGDERTPPRQSSSDSWGKPFRVEWIRTDPLPFHRVKKLRNPWRDNRQVKVSRDGTELEPGVGRQLLEEWNRLHSAVPVDSTKASNKNVKSNPSTTQPASDEEE